MQPFNRRSTDLDVDTTLLCGAQQAQLAHTPARHAALMVMPRRSAP